MLIGRCCSSRTLKSRLEKSILLHHQRSRLSLTLPQFRAVQTPPDYYSQGQIQQQLDDFNEFFYTNNNDFRGMSKPSVSNVEGKKKDSGDAILDRVLSAGKEAMRTRSVQVIIPTKRRHKKQDERDDPKHRIIRVMTAGTLPINETRDFASTEVRINVQPLIVLDLNGILCHRIRRQLRCVDDQLNTVYPFRPQLGPDVAQTPIIPRPDVSSFLEYLDQHFCLAIWTSARTKTANALIKLLLPEPVRERLLFVWSQTQCEASLQTPDSNIPSEMVYRKNLSTVWQKFPMWNVYNTLLIDDSPQKCIYHKANAIHPPPLNGRQVHRNNENNPSFFHPVVQMSDEENATKQLEFMQRLVQHWNTSTVVQTWDSRNDDGLPDTIHNDINDLQSFLTQHAPGHMGYQVPT